MAEDDDPPTFHIYEETATAIFGDSPTLELLHENKLYPFAHEAGVYIPADGTLFITSNQFVNPATGKKKIQISRVKLDRSGGKTTAEVEEIDPKGVPMANGGVNYEGGVLFCAQGEVIWWKARGGLVHMEAQPPYKTRTLVDAFYQRRFNSVNDVVVHSDGSIWFTDPPYGYEQGIRPTSILPPQVYRFDPKGGVEGKGSTRAVADGFGRPNGICFSPDESTVYVTDTDCIHGDGKSDLTRPSTIYAFDVATYSDQPFLTNRRLFAYAEVGVPDGIKCDVDGNVYSGCGDGVNVWSPGGVLLGKIRVKGGVANFCFGKEGEMFLLNENKLWRATLAESTKGALLHGKGEEKSEEPPPVRKSGRAVKKRKSMDTPDAGVVRDSQKSRSQPPLPDTTPKSGGFGSPNCTQDSWTRPRRSQVRQVAKASFLPDDDDSGEEADEQDNNGVMADQPEKFDKNANFDTTASELDSAPDGDIYESENVFNESPTPRASQPAHMPPQSAQPVPRSSRPDSPDPFSDFEALKKHPPAPVASKKPSQQKQTQKPGSAAHGMTTTQGNSEPTTKDTASRPKKKARNFLANSKVKLSPLELEGETDTGRLDGHKPQEYDYSLPASNSNSPATSPAKKKAAPKRGAEKKPVLKANAREAKTAPAGRAKHAKAAPAPSLHLSPDAQPGRGEDENMELEAENSVLQPASREERMHGKANTRAPKPDPPATEEDESHVMISSDSTSSFPESDNEDDEDFECTRKMTPANARRRTRAAAAESQTRKNANAKVENDQPPLPSSRSPEVEDESRRRNAGARSKAQPKQPTKKPAVKKPQAVAAATKHTLELTEETQPPADKPKERNVASEPRAAANRIVKDRSPIKQKNVVSSNVRPEGRGQANKVLKISEPTKQTETSVRKPNIVAFGPGGPKNNGRSQKTTVPTESRPQGQQLGLSNGHHPVASITQHAIGSQRAHKMQSKTTVEDGDSPRDSAESVLNQAGRTSQPNVGRSDPDHAPILEADENALLPPSDADMAELNHEAERADVSDRFVDGDAEADTLVEDATNAVVYSKGQQKHEATDCFDGGFGGEVLERFAPHAKDPRMPEFRTMLGEVDSNRVNIAKDAPAGLSRLMKRKLAEVTDVTEVSPKQHSLAPKTGFQSENFPMLRMNSAALPLETEERPMKKPRYNSARSVRAHEDAVYNSNPFGGPDSLPRGGGYESGEDFFGPAKKHNPFKSSAFDQRWIGQGSEDGGPDQVGSVAPASSVRDAVPRQSMAAIHHPATVRGVASGAVPRPKGNQQSDDMGKRMLAALQSEDPRPPSPCALSEEHGKRFPRDAMKDSGLGATFEQSKASEQDERTSAWKKAAEPYAESVGETMHKIVNTILRGLKANEAAIDDVIEDYRRDGQRVVERIAEKHRKERALVVEQQEQERLRLLQTYGEARQVTRAVQGKLESVDLEKMMLQVGEDPATKRLKKLQQMLADA